MYHAETSRNEQSVERFGRFEDIRNREVGNHSDAVFDRAFEAVWSWEFVHID
jgi:hypothetical protein